MVLEAEKTKKSSKLFKKQLVESESRTFTYQTRLVLLEEPHDILSEVADLMSRVERTLFADLAQGKRAGDLKSRYLKQYGITARHFNALRVKVEGKIASIVEVRKGQIEEEKQRIASLKKKLKDLEGKNKCPFVIHQKKRRLELLTARLKRKEADAANGRIPLCFGTRKLFRSQFDLAANGYTSHEEWKLAWQQARNNGFFLLGSKDETAGNQTCTATLEANGSLTLRLRLPNALAMKTKYLVIPNVWFAYGHAAIATALQRNLERDTTKENSKVAISYRFKLDAKGWTVFVSLPIPEPKKNTQSGIGAIGVDINTDNISVTEIDRFGNPVKSKKIPLIVYGASTNQAKALIGNAAAEIVQWGSLSKKPIILEQLSFQKKKCALREQGSVQQSRMLSSFAYNAIVTAIRSRAFRLGVEVRAINPAYTSIIGRVKFAKRYGLSLHSSAALCIARRFLGVSERVPRHMDAIPDGKGGHVTVSLPVRNGDRHVWTSWRQINKKLQAVLAARFRAHTMRSSSRGSSSACCDRQNLPDPVGETPTREPLTELLG